MKRIFLSIFVMILLCGASALSHAAPIFNPATDHWYDIVTGDWYTAEANSVALSGHLVTINDAIEQDWLIRNFSSDRYYWIGFNKVGNSWVWSSGEPVTYVNWAPGQPDNGGRDGEYVAVMNYNGPGRWNDYCSNCTNIGIAEWGSSNVPEPGTLILMGLGLAGLAICRRHLRSIQS